MRELKFRVWDKQKEKMFEVMCLYSKDQVEYRDGLSVITLCRRDGDEFSIMQYTGIKDKNGKEIYEEDVVKIYNEEMEFIGVVKYDDKYGIYMFDIINDEFNWSMIEVNMLNMELEVIGNIYEMGGGINGRG